MHVVSAVDMGLRWIVSGWLILNVYFFSAQAGAPYYGTKIGTFKTFAHDVVGDVYAVDDRTIFLKDFSYDGQGPG
ncbi:Protein Skeletor, isoforms D/E, partial [Stegodyphus mimosarum]